MNPSDLIHLVIGQSGEYSSHSTWVVCWYEEKKKAIEHVLTANATVEEIWEKIEAVHQQNSEWHEEKRQSIPPKDWNAFWLSEAFQSHDRSVRAAVCELLRQVKDPMLEKEGWTASRPWYSVETVSRGFLEHPIVKEATEGKV